MRERELLDERLAVAARREIGARPGDRLRAVEADDSAHDAVEQFVRAHAIDARRRFARKGLALADGALAERIAVEEGGGAVEQLEPLRMIEGVVEPAERIAIFVAVLRGREVERVARLDQHLGGADLQHVENLARSLTGEQQAGDVLELGRLVLVERRVEQRLRLGERERFAVLQKRQFFLGGAGIGDGGYFLFLDVMGDAVARHFVR